MQIKPFTFLAGLIALFTSSSAAIKTPFNATFDTLKASISSALESAPVGIYNNISYSNFGVSQPGLAGVYLNGIVPESPPKIAVGFTSGASSLSIAYPGSKIKSFGLNNFYYGCGTALKNAEANSAVACNLTVMGYKAGSSKAVAEKTFEFTPDAVIDLMNPMTLGTFSSAFQGLEYANFTFTPSTLVVFIIDNLVGSTQS